MHMASERVLIGRVNLRPGATQGFTALPFPPFFFFLRYFVLYSEHDQMKETNHFPPVACELILNSEQVTIFRQKRLVN